MKVLIINQPTGNRGDESAHKALVRCLLNSLRTEDSIEVAFFGEPGKATLPFIVKDKRANYLLIESSYGKCRVPIMAFKYKLANFLCLVLPAYRKMDALVKSADYVICAPGGICMGKFMNWDHIFWLSRAIRYKKKLAYFSRSFGPFNKGGKYDALFEIESLRILHNCNIISIRDKRTMAFADSINIPYVPSIDAAFLDNPVSSLTLSDFSLECKQFIVFVPNSLTWQPAYKAVNQSLIDEFHLHIIERISEKYPNYKIVMMPQLFGRETNSDFNYFKSLRNKSTNNNAIVVVDDTVSSDIQQMIIKNACFVIGGRYHSIVFSINNQTPFISLSYEDKMFGLLAILGLDNYQIDVRRFLKEDCNIDDMKKEFDSLFETNKETDMSSYTKTAKEIANNSFQLLLKSIYN